MGSAAPSIAGAGRASRARNPLGTSSTPLWYARYAWGVLAFNLSVIAWGAFVRATGSGAGCGNHWPLCNGEVLPRSPAVATLIEFGHRISSGLDLMLVAGLVFGAWRAFPRAHPVRGAAALSAVFLVTEALIGAGLVLLQHVATDASVGRGFWVAGHLVNTFLLVACLALTAWWASGYAPPRRARAGSLLVVMGAALGGVLLIGVSGAVTALGDTLFPAATLAEAKALTFSDTAHLFVRLRIWHPALALVVAVVVLAASAYAVAHRRTRTVRVLAVALVGLYATQLAVGAVNVWLLAPVTIQLAHLVLSDCVWTVLVLLTAAALAAEPDS
jgi:heme A synthase